MLKHVQVSPHRNRSDSVSLRSSTSCASSLCGSPEPPIDSLRSSSRASSYCSLNETIPQTTIKVFTACLRLDIEYKTLGIQWDTTSKDVVTQILRRCKMRQKDPHLFYLSMEVTVRKAGVKTVLALDDEARPAILQACHPKGDSRFCLQMKPGGLIRVHTSVLQPTSLYKSLFISEETTSDELLTLLLSCFNLNEPVEQYSLYEVCPSQEYQRKLHPDDLPLRAQQQRTQRSEQCHFIVRKNPHYARRRQLLPPIVENKSITTTPLILDSSALTVAVCDRMSDLRLNNNSTPISSPSMTKLDIDDSVISTATTTTATMEVTTPLSTKQRYTSVYEKCVVASVCKQCRNTFRLCEFCQKNDGRKLNCTRLTRIPTAIDLTECQQKGDEIIYKSSTNFNATTTYNPVYNIREIRTVGNSFSALGVDKKILDVETSHKASLSSPNTPSTITSNNSTNSVVQEVVNNNPAKGYGNFVYI